MEVSRTTGKPPLLLAIYGIDIPLMTCGEAYAGQDLKDEDFYDGQNITGVLLGAG